MQAAHWSKLGGTISGSVDKGDTEFVSLQCTLLLFTMEQATERYHKIPYCATGPRHPQNFGSPIGLCF